MSTVIIGADGFIGRHLTARLAGEGVPDLILVSRRRADAELAAKYPQARFVEGDLGDVEMMAEICRPAETVYQLAWGTTPHTSNANPVADLQTNAQANLRLIDRLALSFRGRFVFISSGGAVYGIPQKLPVPENHPIHPLSSYGIGKSVVERYLELYGRLHGLDYTILRVANPYGPGQKVKNAQGVIAAILSCLKTGQPFTLWGDGSVIRDYVHVRDVAKALAIAGRHPQARGESFNIGSGRGESVQDIIEMIERLSGQKILVNRLPPRKEDVPVNQLEIAKARALLGWSPDVGLEDGLRELIAETVS